MLGGSAGGSDGSDGGLDGRDPGGEVGEVVWNETSRLIVRQRPTATRIVEGGYLRGSFISPKMTLESVAYLAASFDQSEANCSFDGPSLPTTPELTLP